MNKQMNQFNPSFLVKVVDTTKGVEPLVLIYRLRDKDRTSVSAEPDFDEFDAPVYNLPRFYAERLLANNGGRVYKLVSPNKLTIRVDNGRGGKEYKDLIACKKRADDNWHELSQEELEAAEKGEKVPTKPEIEPVEKKPAKTPGLSKAATRKPTAPPKKKVEKADDSLESLLSDD